jgi:hypothetical protein
MCTLARSLNALIIETAAATVATIPPYHATAPAVMSMDISAMAAQKIFIGPFGILQSLGLDHQGLSLCFVRQLAAV